MSALAAYNYMKKTPGTITLTDVCVTSPSKYSIVKTVEERNHPDGRTEVLEPVALLDENGKAATKVTIAKEHSWDTGKVTKDATETVEGEKTYTCSICGETKTEAIPKLAPAADPAKQMGEDGTAFGKGASAEAAEAAILSLKNDNDPAGTVFNSLQFKAAKTTKSSIKLTWKKIKGAKKYVLYANKCGKKNKYKKLKALTKILWWSRRSPGRS